jgi:hypothetical protein
MARKYKALTSDERAPIEQTGSLRIVDELYGYTVRVGHKERRKATLVEWVAHAMAFALLFGTLGMILAPQGLGGSGVDVFEFGIAVLGVALAGWFFWIGTRGTAVELQVDQARREIRTAVRNWRNNVRVLESHPFRNVESVFVHKRSQKAEKGKLCIGTYAEPRGIELIEAGSHELRHLYKALARGLRPNQAEPAKAA